MTERMTVALVDDDQGVHEDYGRFFAGRPDFEFVGSAYCGEDGIALHREKHPDVMLMDMKLPDMLGSEAIAAIKKESPDAHVVALTVFEDEASVAHALLAGADGYLLKCSTGDEIVDALHRSVQGQLPLDPRIGPAITHLAARAHLAELVEPYPLSQRELELARWLATGHPYRVIAKEMCLSEGTIRQYVSHINERLGTHSRSSIVAALVKTNVIDPTDLPTRREEQTRLGPPSSAGHRR